MCCIRMSLILLRLIRISQISTIDDLFTFANHLFYSSIFFSESINRQTVPSVILPSTHYDEEVARLLAKELQWETEVEMEMRSAHYDAEVARLVAEEMQREMEMDMEFDIPPYQLPHAGKPAFLSFLSLFLQIKSTLNNHSISLIEDNDYIMSPIAGPLGVAPSPLSPSPLSESESINKLMALNLVTEEDVLSSDAATKLTNKRIASQSPEAHHKKATKRVMTQDPRDTSVGEIPDQLTPTQPVSPTRM